ncbi:MAG TPA: HEAT repeat domain-containing protein [Planctomycetota bacterium]|nr:HEAT repeat domain-containing protein [Planctomycetota bacterium]
MTPPCPWVLLALALAPTADDPAADFARVLHGVDLVVDEVERVKLARELAGLPRAVELHLSASVSGRFPDGTELDAGHVALLERAADELARAELVTVVESGLEQGREPEWWQAALELLGRRGAAVDLRLMVRLHDDGHLGQDAHREFGDAAQRLFERDAQALEALEGLSLVGDRATFELMGVVGRTCGPAGVDWLTRQLADDDLADTALRALGRVAPEVALDRAPELADDLRHYLGAESAQRRRLALRVVVGLQDERSIPRLVELLGSSEPGEARAAARALQELTGRDLPGDAATWNGWLAQELEWWGARSEPALESLWSEEPAVAVAAVGEVAARGLLRDRLAGELARVLREHPLHEVRERACRGLAQLRSRAACPELLVALEGPDGEVRQLAWRALRSVTGLAHPPEAWLWRDALAL